MPEKKVAKLVVHLHRIPEAFVRTSPPPPIAKIQFHYSNNIAFLKHHSNAEKTRLAYYDHSYARQPNNNNASSCGHLCHGDDNLLPPAAIAFYGATAGESCTIALKCFPSVAFGSLHRMPREKLNLRRLFFCFWFSQFSAEKFHLTNHF